MSHEKYRDWLEEAIDELEAAKRLFGACRRGGSQHSWRGVDPALSLSMGYTRHSFRHFHRCKWRPFPRYLS
ncbi:MAG: hypothetical protein LM590_12115 [Thermofilum sp.]|nr:hypothetical protein [Thermofilum sp.]